MSLLALIREGHSEAAFQLLEQNPELASEPGVCLEAMYHGFRNLAEAIADNRSSLTPHEAAALGRLDDLPQSGLTDYSPDGWQPLHLAAFFGHLDVVKKLIASRVPLNELSQNPLRVAPLHSALANGHEAIARELVFEGADTSLPSGSAWTPLHYAAYQGNRALTQFLLEHGAISKPGPEGKLPSEIAREKGFSEVEALLNL